MTLVFQWAVVCLHSPITFSLVPSSICLPVYISEMSVFLIKPWHSERRLWLQRTREECSNVSGLGFMWKHICWYKQDHRYDSCACLDWISWYFNLFVIIKSITVTYLFREKPRNSALSLSLTVTSALQRIGGTLESPYLTQPLLISAALAEGSWVLYSHAVGQSKVKSSLKFSVSALSLHPVVCLLWSVLQKQIWLRNISDLVCSARVKKQFFLGFYFLTISVLAYS